LTGSSEGAAETGGAFTADDTDYNTFNADRKLIALQAIMQTLGKISQKKAVIYFSNGISQNGVDNQSALRAATASAVKANVSIYPVDIRGCRRFLRAARRRMPACMDSPLTTELPCSTISAAMHPRRKRYRRLHRILAEKRSLIRTISAPSFPKCKRYLRLLRPWIYQHECDEDGRFRHLKVQLNRPDLKLDYRSGYYAGRDFEHLNRADREQQIQDELASELSQTDVAVYAGASYSAGRFALLSFRFAGDSRLANSLRAGQRQRQRDYRCHRRSSHCGQ